MGSRVEANVAIICGCLYVLYLIFTFIRNKLMSNNSPPLNAFIRHHFFRRANRHTITPEVHTPRPGRSASFGSGLGVSSQALNWQDAGTWDRHGQTRTPYNESLDLELSSWESSSRRTTEGLCLECVDSYERCRKHDIGMVDKRFESPVGWSQGRGRGTNTVFTLTNHRSRPSSCGELERRKRRGVHQQKASWSA